MQYRYFSEGQLKEDPTTGTKCRTGQLNHQFVEQKFVGGVWVGIGDNDGVRYSDVAAAGCRFREGMLNGDYRVDVELEIAGFLLAEGDGWENIGGAVGWEADAKAVYDRMVALGETPDSQQRDNLVNTISALKAADLYNGQFDALWLTRAKGVGSAKLNLINQYENITWSEVYDAGSGYNYYVHTSVELDNGDLLAGVGNYDGHYWRSIDKGVNWTDEGVICAGEVACYYFCDLGGGVVLVGTGLNGKILRSIDYGHNWIENSSVNAIWAAKGAVAEHQYVVLFENLGNGIIIATSENSPTPATACILRSVDYGITWVDMGVAGTDLTVLNMLCNIGNGIVLVGGGRDEGFGVFSAPAHMLRSDDWGATWSDLGHVAGGESRLVGSAYLGNGIVVAGTANAGQIIRSTDYGVTWVLVGGVENPNILFISKINNFGNGMALAMAFVNGYAGKIFGTDDYGESWFLLGMPENGQNVMEMVKLNNGKLLISCSTDGSIGAKIFISTSEIFKRKLTNDYDLVKQGAGALTFIPDSGFKSDGSTSYLDTNFISQLAGSFTKLKYKQNNACFGFKISGNIGTGWQAIGGQAVGVTPVCYFATKTSTGEYYVALNGAALTAGAQSISVGYNCLSRALSTGFKQLINANSYDIANNSSSLLDAKLYLLATDMYPNPWGFIANSAVLEVAWVGKSMTQAKFLQFQTIINNYIANL